MGWGDANHMLSETGSIIRKECNSFAQLNKEMVNGDRFGVNW